MPKSVNSIDCQCGGHYVKKNRSRHMETNKHQSYIQNLDFIDWDDMDFGTEDTSQGADTKFHCDIHKETLLVHDGDGGLFCSECGFSYE